MIFNLFIEGEEPETVAPDEPENVRQNEVVEPAKGIDPVAKANIEWANISDAIKKKAIAYLNANPTSHKIPAIGGKSLDAIMQSIKIALFAEIKALSPLIKQRTLMGGDSLVLSIDDGGKENIRIMFIDSSHKLSFMVVKDYEGEEIFDSTSTLEGLRQWGFALPFDLDVKAFVANVIKPVVDEFLAKAQEVDNAPTETESNEMDLELQKNLPKGTIVGGSADIEDLAQKIIDKEIPANEKHAVRYSIVGDAEAEKIKLATGFDVKGYKHTIDSFGIRHAISQHGDEKKESKRGQIAITTHDISKIPEIIISPDSIESAGKDASGNDLIRYSKKYDGIIYYVEEIREGRMELVAKTLWKTRLDVVMPENSQQLTSETTEGNPPEVGENIAQPPQNATADIDAELAELETLIGAGDIFESTYGRNGVLSGQRGC
jgi:hypothetical protein